jgi:hypothetical protein
MSIAFVSANMNEVPEIRYDLDVVELDMKSIMGLTRISSLWQARNSQERRMRLIVESRGPQTLK